MNEYEKMHMYDRILNEVVYNKKIERTWLCEPNEESYTSQICDIIQKYKSQMKAFRREALVVERALLLEMYDAKTEKDTIVLNYLYRSMQILREAFYNTEIFYNSLKLTLKEFRIKEDSDIVKVIKTEIRIKSKRINEKRSLIANDFIPYSVIRPYYFNLQKQGISFRSDIENHISMDTPFDQEKEKIHEYTLMIMEYGKNSGKTNYIEARDDIYEKIMKRRERIQEEKRVQKEVAKDNRLNYKLMKFVKSKELQYRQNPNITCLRAARSHPNYNISTVRCDVIVALCKINGAEKFRYFTGNGLDKYIQKSEFYFDGDIRVLSGKEECMKLPNVIKVDTLQIF